MKSPKEYRTLLTLVATLEYVADLLQIPTTEEEDSACVRSLFFLEKVHQQIERMGGQIWESKVMLDDSYFDQTYACEDLRLSGQWRLSDEWHEVWFYVTDASGNVPELHPVYGKEFLNELRDGIRRFKERHFPTLPLVDEDFDVTMIEVAIVLEASNDPSDTKRDLVQRAKKKVAGWNSTGGVIQRARVEGRLRKVEDEGPHRSLRFPIDVFLQLLFNNGELEGKTEEVVKEEIVQSRFDLEILKTLDEDEDRSLED